LFDLKQHGIAATILLRRPCGYQAGRVPVSRLPETSARLSAKTLMGDIVASPYPVAAYCLLVDDLYGYARPDIRIGAVGVFFEQVPIAKNKLK
jgi:hypothetical protein